MSKFARRIPTPSGSPDYYLSAVNNYLAEIEKIHPQLSRYDPTSTLLARSFWRVQQVDLAPVRVQEVPEPAVVPRLHRVEHVAME